MSHSCWNVTDEEYLAAPAAAVLAFHGIYPQGKQGCIEIIHHGERIATCGQVRPHPCRWRPENHAELEERRADPADCAVDVRVTQPALDSAYAVRCKEIGKRLS
jgi:hypothetical protein